MRNKKKILRVGCMPKGGGVTEKFSSHHMHQPCALLLHLPHVVDSDVLCYSSNNFPHSLY